MASDTGSAASRSTPERRNRQLAAVLFVDIVDSTRLMQEDEQLAIESRARFGSVVDTEHEAFGGTVVQYYGDGALGMFANSLDAVMCAVAIQRELQADLQVPARIGIHVGNVLVEPAGIIGDAVNIASRIESFGIAGGVLVSDSIRDQIANRPELGFVDLGVFRLKNVGRPFRIFAVSVDGLVVPSPDEVRGKGERFAVLPGGELPEFATPLLGRSDDVAALSKLVEDHRIVTLTGPGGVGKTRAAVETGRQLVARFADGVCFVSVAEVSDPAGLVPALAEALDVKEAEGRSLSNGIAALIGDREILLILDNVEQVVEAAPEVAAIVSACPHLHLLATSRTPLRVSAEQQYALPPLPLPPVADHGAAATPEKFPGVALFVDRAKMANSRFDLTENNVEEVVEICRRMDGLPLAIELAAARVGLLTPEALLQRLDHALDILTTGARDHPDRQQTLRATIDWSYSLLGDPERRLLRRMSLFSGGCSLESVEAVCAVDGVSVLDDLASLIDKGLVQTGSGQRFQMLQTIREYALEELASSREADEVAWRHAVHFAEIATAIRVGIEGGDQVAAVERGVAEDTNVRAALDFLLRGTQRGDHSSAELGMRICGDLYLFWHIRAKHVSAREYSRAFLRSPAAQERTIARSNALRNAGVASWVLGHPEEGVEANLEASAIANELGVDAEAAITAFCLALAYLSLDAPRALEWTGKGVEQARAVGDPWILGFSLTIDGILHVVTGDAEGAASRYEEALAIQRSIGDHEGGGMSVSGLAALASMRGDLTEAIDLYQRSLTHFEAIGDRAEEARVLDETAWVHLRAGNLQGARRWFLDSIRAYGDIGSVRGIGASMIGLAALESMEDRPVHAVQIAAAAEVFAAEEGVVNVYSEGVPGHEYVERARAGLSAKQVESALQAGRALSVKEALALAGVAEVGA